MKKSKYDNYSREEFQKIVDNANSIREVIIKIGLSANGQGGYRTFHKKVKQFGIDVGPLRERTKRQLMESRIGRKINLSDVLVKGSDYARASMKRRLLSSGMLENKCYVC
jgi:hypothetical protein